MSVVVSRPYYNVVDALVSAQTPKQVSQCS